MGVWLDWFGEKEVGQPRPKAAQSSPSSQAQPWELLWSQPAQPCPGGGDSLVGVRQRAEFPGGNCLGLWDRPAGLAALWSHCK